MIERDLRAQGAVRRGQFAGVDMSVIVLVMRDAGKRKGLVRPPLALDRPTPIVSTLALILDVLPLTVTATLSRRSTKIIPLMKIKSAMLMATSAASRSSAPLA